MTKSIKKIILISSSTGKRGNAGKKKIYDITIHGNLVTLTWGMAEKSVRQTKTLAYFDSTSAHNFAMEKQWEKIAKGYEVAYTA